MPKDMIGTRAITVKRPACLPDGYPDSGISWKTGEELLRERAALIEGNPQVRVMAFLPCIDGLLLRDAATAQLDWNVVQHTRSKGHQLERLSVRTCQLERAIIEAQNHRTLNQLQASNVEGSMG